MGLALCPLCGGKIRVVEGFPRHTACDCSMRVYIPDGMTDEEAVMQHSGCSRRERDMRIPTLKCPICGAVIKVTYGGRGLVEASCKCSMMETTTDLTYKPRVAVLRHHAKMCAIARELRYKGDRA